MQILDEVKTSIQSMGENELIAMLNDCIIQAEKQLAMACEILVELEKRQGRRHPLTSRGLFRYYREIQGGKLEIKAALEFAGSQFILDHIKHIARNKQRKFADGAVTKVVEIDHLNRPVAVEKSLLQMSREQIELLFDHGKLRPIGNQIEIMRKRISEGKVNQPVEPPHIKVEALLDQKVIKIGWMRVHPEDLVKALSKLGWSLTKQ